MSVPIVGNGSAKPSATTLMLIWAIFAFLVGTFFSAGMGWGRGSTSLDNLTLSVAKLEAAVNALSEKYSISDKATAQELQRMEDHLTYNDNRLDRVEAVGSRQQK